MHQFILFCHEFRVVMKHCQMHPNTTRCTKTWVYGSMGWIGSVHCEKLWCDFMARTCALIAPVHTILHRVSCSYETITNAPKHYETYENMSLGSNGVDWVRSLWKISTWLRGTNFCINCTSCFASSFMRLRNDPKCTKHYATHQNMSLGSNGVDWVRLLQNISTRRCGTYFCINCTNSHCIAPSFMQLRNDPNSPKHYATHQNMRSGSNGVDWVRSLRKIPTWLRGTNFCINCTSSPCFASCLMQLWNDPKCTQTLCNTPKHEFRVQRGGLGAFVPKNPDLTSWHELLY